jgi:glycosyltransferase involved in cell wall biosynthesis
MSGVKIFGICLVKNEDDIIAQTLTFATRHCDRIFVLDNGSTDETWNIVEGLARENAAIIPFEQTLKPYDDALRAMVYNAVHTELAESDWWLILDSDEFLAEDPRPVIETAVNEGADTINAWQIQFSFTDRDLDAWQQGNDHRDMPIFNRRRYYMINWQENRLFRNDPRRYWDGSVSNVIPEWLRRVSRRRILNRHYQFRDPEQMDKRLRLRYGHHRFPHVHSPDWRNLIRDSRGLNYYRDGDPWKFKPSGLIYYYRKSLYQRMRSAYHGGALRRVRRLLKQGTKSSSIQ